MNKAGRERKTTREPERYIPIYFDDFPALTTLRFTILNQLFVHFAIVSPHFMQHNLQQQFSHNLTHTRTRTDIFPANWQQL